MNKVVYVKAFFKPIGEQKAVKVPTGETKKGFFGGEKEVKRTEYQWVRTGLSDRWIDGPRLAVDIASVVSELNNQGYEVVSITPVTSGAYNYECKHQDNDHRGHGAWGYGYGYGYSYTEGVIIIASTDIMSDDVSLEKGSKKCPSCAETIKLEVLKCRYCGYAFDNAEVNQQLSERRLKLAEIEKQFLEERRLEIEKIEMEGRIQCPQCDEWDVLPGAVVEEGYTGDWCPNCKKSIQRMLGKI